MSIPVKFPEYNTKIIEHDLNIIKKMRVSYLRFIDTEDITKDKYIIFDIFRYGKVSAFVYYNFIRDFTPSRSRNKRTYTLKAVMQAIAKAQIKEVI